MELRMMNAITEYTTEWLYITPDKSQTTAAPTTPPTPNSTQPQGNTPGAQKLTPKAVPELKPKNILTANTSRVDLVAWLRAMKAYFAASNFDLCSPEVKVYYLEERMDAATFRMLRKLTGNKPHNYSMETLYKYIRESVVRSDSLQHRRIGLLEFKQRTGETYSQALCRVDEADIDSDIENYNIEEFRLHIRLAGCNDIRLKEELLKLSDKGSEKPLTIDNIFEVCRAYNKG